MGKSPVRIQRKRTKGWKMPANTIYVGRPSKWGNEYILGDDGITRHEVVEKFKRYSYATQSPVGRERIRNELKGKNLACWCNLDAPCHADILLKIAND